MLGDLGILFAGLDFSLITPKFMLTINTSNLQPVYDKDLDLHYPHTLSHSIRWFGGVVELQLLIEVVFNSL